MTHWNFHAPWHNPALAGEIRTLMQFRADAVRSDYNNFFSAGAMEAVIGVELARRVRPWTNNLMYVRGTTPPLDEGLDLASQELARPWLIFQSPATRFADVADDAVAFVKDSMDGSLCFLGRAEAHEVLVNAHKANSWRKRAVEQGGPRLYTTPYINGVPMVGNLIGLRYWNRQDDYWASPTHPFAHVRNFFTREVT
jgi:hypothetical protein